MLNLEQIKELNKTSQRVVKINSWGGEVTIKPLTIKERNEVLAVLESDGDKINVSKAVKAQILTASLALVEPKLSVSEIEALNEESFEGIKEICDLLGTAQKK